MRGLKWLTFIVIIGGIPGFLYSCRGEKDQVIPQLDFGGFEAYLYKNNDTVYVINFWATWCKPCLKELPDLEKINVDYQNKKVKVILVSLDFPNQYNDVLLPFVAERQISSDVVHLIDVDANKWIGKVSEEWSGAIPATLIYKGSDREFHESAMTYDQLKSIVESKL